MSDQVGPGETRYIANDDGGIDCQLWNDPNWRTTFARDYDLCRPELIATLLAKAYQQGFADRGVVIRRAIGTPHPRLG